MKAELKEKWVAALRSGEYKQGKNLLHNREDNTFCCLGVLCKVMGASFRRFDTEDGDGTIYEYSPVLNGEVLSDGASEELSAHQAEKLGLLDVVYDLMDMNDGRGVRPHSFPEIADYIEAQIPAEAA